jgi:hypothetical protein
MQSVAQLVHLVDLDGFDVPCTERAHGPEPDPTDPANWPSWTDDWYWSTTRPDASGALVSSLGDRLLEAWLDQVDHEELIKLARVTEGILSLDGVAPPDDQAAETTRAWLNGNPSFSAWLTANGGPR